MEQALHCLQIEFLVVKKHLKQKRLEINANILFTYNKLFIEVLGITITIYCVLRYTSPSETFKVAVLSLISYFHDHFLFLTLSFILPWRT